MNFSSQKYSPPYPWEGAVIDKARWHEVDGGGHLILYACWILSSGLNRGRKRALNRTQTPSEICFAWCDGSLCAEDLSLFGNAFTYQYYQSHFENDLELALGSIVVQAPDWDAFDRLARILDQRLREYSAVSPHSIDEKPMNVTTKRFVEPWRKKDKESHMINAVRDLRAKISKIEREILEGKLDGKSKKELEYHLSELRERLKKMNEFT